MDPLNSWLVRCAAALRRSSAGANVKLLVASLGRSEALPNPVAIVAQRHTSDRGSAEAAISQPEAFMACMARSSVTAVRNDPDASTAWHEF